MPTPNVLEPDLEAALDQTRDLWEDLRGQRLLMTGGTGFFGFWLLRTFLHAEARLALGSRVLVLSRHPQTFARRAPELATRPAVTLVQGDVRSFAFPAGECTHVIHLATETNSSLDDPRPAAYFDTSVRGTARVLEFARARGTRRLLLASSGAVYGPQPETCRRIPETYLAAPPPEDTRAAYAHGKRAAEFLCAAAAAETALGATVARGFAFVGPGLPLDSGFAIGNFIRDALYSDHITIKGDGTPLRSYLYGSDLAVWLWTILFKGTAARPYNVGSEADLDILSLARLVAALSGRDIPVQVTATSRASAGVTRYVPDTSRARTELGLSQKVELADAIVQTMRWLRSDEARGWAPD